MPITRSYELTSDLHAVKHLDMAYFEWTAATSEPLLIPEVRFENLLTEKKVYYSKLFDFV